MGSDEKGVKHCGGPKVWRRRLPCGIWARFVLLWVVTLVPMLGLLSWMCAQRYHQRRTEEFRTNLMMARAVGLAFCSYVDDISRQELALGEALVRLGHSRSEADLMLASSARAYPTVESFCWVDLRGRVLASSDPRLVGHDLSRQPAFRSLPPGQSWVSDLFRLPDGADWRFAIIEGIAGARGEAAGVIVARIVPERLADTHIRLSRPDHGGISLVDRSGRCVFRYAPPNPYPIGADWANEYPEIRPALKGRDALRILTDHSMHGQRRISAWSPISGIGWAAGAGRPEEAALAPVRQSIARDGALFALVDALALLAALLISRGIAGPIRRLQADVHRLGEGDLGHRASADGPLEVAGLAEAFNAMAARIQEQTETVQAQHEELRAQHEELTQAHESLAARAAELGAVFAAQNDAILIYDANMNVLRANPSFPAAYGFDPVGLNVTEIIQRVSCRHLDGRPLVLEEQPTPRALRGEAVAGMSFLVKKADGSEAAVATSSGPMRVGGAIIGSVTVWHDITERVRAEEEVRRSERRLSVILDSIADGFYALDGEWRIVHINDAALRYFGRAREEMLGRMLFDAIPEAKGSIFETEYRRAVERGEPAHFETVSVATGHVVEMHAYPGANNLTVLFRDVTERVRLQEALREADRRKDDFLAMLAHELRNPLAAVAASVDIAGRRAEADPVLQRAAAAGRRQVRNMARMLDDLLDVARITRGHISLYREPVEIAAVVQAAVETIAPKIERYAHKLTVSLPPEPLLVDGDRLRLSQVVANLLDNAAKYTPHGGQISVEVWGCGGVGVWGYGGVEVPDAEVDGSATPIPPHPHTATSPEVVLRVRDNGKGIPPELLPHVFCEFERGEHSTGDDEGGLGLGLSLARRLVELHGGSLEAHSDGRGRGSEFVVRLPALPAAEASPEPAEAPPHEANRLRVLVVDDSPDVAEMLALLVEDEGHEAEVATSGAAALDLVEGQPGGAPPYLPDVVLLDLGMANMDGFEVARRLQMHPKAPSLVAITGYGQEEDRARAREAGFAHHLLKPVDLPALQRVLAAVEVTRR